MVTYFLITSDITSWATVEGMQIVFSLEVYGVKEILGIQYGFKGFVDKKYPPVMVSPDFYRSPFISTFVRRLPCRSNIVVPLWKPTMTNDTRTSPDFIGCSHLYELGLGQLTRKIVQRINMVGGSFLGVSRGCPPLKDIVDKLEVSSQCSLPLVIPSR